MAAAAKIKQTIKYVLQIICFMYSTIHSLDIYNLIFIFREDVKDESPKIGETSFPVGDAFPLKKDDKSLKTTKLMTEDKKSAQKSLEPTSKKSAEIAKKKREKRDGSTDSEDSDAESKYIF